MPISGTNHNRSPQTARRTRSSLAALLVLPLLALLASCGYGSDSDDDKNNAPAAAGSGGPAGGGTSASQIRLGFFANVTHATPLVGLQEGFFAKELGSTTIKEQVFNAGPSAIEAIKGGSLDATYIGPNPAISGFTSTNGELIRIVAGATSGGASLVVKPDINSPADLKGKRIASPQLANTQDVALRAWLTDQGYKVDTTGKGDVVVVPTQNAQTLQAFQKGEVDGAWLPEPWATRLVQEAGGKVLLDERTLWPEGKFVTTHLIVATKFLKEHPDTVEALIRGQIAANDWITANPAKARESVNAGLAKHAGKPLEQNTIDAAWNNLTITNDPVASSLRKSSEDGVRVDVAKAADINGIYDLTILNKVLTGLGRPPVSDGGLGPKQ